MATKSSTSYDGRNSSGKTHGNQANEIRLTGKSPNRQNNLHDHIYGDVSSHSAKPQPRFSNSRSEDNQKHHSINCPNKVQNRRTPNKHKGKKYKRAENKATAASGEQGATMLDPQSSSTQMDPTRSHTCASGARALVSYRRRRRSGGTSRRTTTMRRVMICRLLIRAIYRGLGNPDVWKCEGTYGHSSILKGVVMQPVGTKTGHGTQNQNLL